MIVLLGLRESDLTRVKFSMRVKYFCDGAYFVAEFSFAAESY